MIRNEREYRITKARAAEFARSLAAHRAASSGEVHPKIRKAQLDAVSSQLEELQGQLKAYESLRSGRESTIRVDSLDDLPRVFIQARIAGGMTQLDLAQRLGLRQQQIQRYEATRYASASLARVEEVARALGITVRGRILLRKATTRPAARLVTAKR